MALVGKFLADFSDFYAAVQQADVKLKSLGEGAATVGNRLNRMVDQFSGRQLIQEATVMTAAIDKIGGVGKLTAAELDRVSSKAAQASEKMKALGMEVPASLQKMADAAKPLAQGGGLFERLSGTSGVLAANLKTVGIAFGASEALQFAKSIMASADAMTKLEAKTGISIQGLQRLEYAGDDAGNSLDELTNAVTQAQNRLASGDKAFVAAAESMGLSVAELRQLAPDELFMTLSTALRQVDDPAKQVALAIDLMGKSGAAVLPTMKRGFDDLYGAIVGPSPEAVKAIDDAGDALGRLKLRVRGFFTEAFGKALIDLKENPSGFLMKYLWGQQSPQDVLDDMDRAANAVDPFIQKTLEMNRARAAAPIAAPLPGFDAASLEVAEAAGRRLDAEDAKRRADQKRRTEEQAEALKKLNAEQRDYNNFLVLREFADEEARLKRVAEATAEAAKSQALFTTWIYNSATPLETQNDLLLQLERNMAAMGVAATKAGEGMVWGVAPTGLETFTQSFGSKMFAGFGDFLKGNLGDSIIKAFQGGGDVVRSMGSTVGSWFTREGGAIEKAATKGLSGIFGKGLGGALGSIIPGIGTVLGPALDAAMSGIKKLFGRDEEATTVNPLRDQFIAAAGGLDQLNMKAHDAGLTLDELLRADKATEFEAAIKNLEAGFLAQDDAMKVAIETAQKYGFTLEELGPALQRQELDKQAQQLFKDWEVLNAAGINTIAITDKMSESVNAYVQSALAMGAEVPEAMRPMLEAMVAAGELTDANGNKIESLEDSGISFALSMSDGFKKLIDSVDKLSLAISRGLGLAVDSTSDKIRKMPREVGVQVVYHDPGFKAQEEVFTSGGGGELESYQAGSEGFRDFGQGTPVMLHGMEAVVPLTRPSTPGPPLLGGGGEATPIVIHTHLVVDGRELATVVERIQNADFMTRNRMRAA